MAKHTLLDKLTTLIKANLRDVTPSLSAFPRQGNLSKELAHLKRQIASAETDEQTMLAGLAQLEAEIAQWDQAADLAVQAHQDAQARYAIEKMELAKQRYHMANHQIEQHRRSLYELMAQVNQLESLLQPENTPPESSADDTPLSEAIRQAWEEVQAEGDVVRVQLQDEINTEVEASKVEEDLAVRRSRLAKPE